MNEIDDPGCLPGIPDAFDVSVVLQVPRAGEGPFGGEVIGVVAMAARDAGTIRSDAKGEQILRPGFRLKLYKDEAESYYMNLTGDQPSVFVICHQDEDEALEPALVTLSYDEASSYMEVEDAVFSVPMQPELYRWLESFVLENYIPQRKQKRKRDNWREMESR